MNTSQGNWWSMKTLQACAEGKLTDKHNRRECGRSYAEIYEQYMAPMRDRPNGLLVELGVSGGGSLLMWQEYFGWRVLGIDIQPNCTQHAKHDLGIEVLTYGQDDFAVYEEIKARGGADIIVDDAAHLNKLIVRSFGMLWPLVKPGGLYIIEDTLLSYVKDIRAETIAGGWGGMSLCKEPLENDRTDIDKLLKGLAESIDCQNKENQVAEYHVHPQVIIIRKMGNVTTG